MAPIWSADQRFPGWLDLKAQRFRIIVGRCCFLGKFQILGQILDSNVIRSRSRNPTDRLFEFSQPRNSIAFEIQLICQATIRFIFQFRTSPTVAHVPGLYSFCRQEVRRRIQWAINSTHPKKCDQSRKDKSIEDFMEMERDSLRNG
jgi:hypothetical protein